MKIRTLLPALLVVFWACSPGLPQPDARDASRAQTRWPDSSLDELGRGRELYVKSCSGCHALKAPTAVDPAQWDAKVSKMRKRHGVKITDEEADVIVRYLWTVATRSR